MTSNQTSFQVPAEMRDFAEKGVEQARSAVTAVLQNARKATSSLHTSTQAAELPASVAFSRSLEFTEQNVGAAFELAQKLLRAQDFAEVIRLQSDYARAQVAVLQSQAKELLGAASSTGAQSV